ncbi:MAG: sucrase ferredoxin [Thainema sp.]
MISSSESVTTCPDADLCAVFSKQNGEDPIGSASECDRYLVIEVAPPWGRNALQADDFPKDLMPILQQAAQRSAKGRCLAIAPDPNYSKPGYRRILYWQRPSEQFATYEKQEFWVPNDQVIPLVQALHHPDQLAAFDAYRQDNTMRDLLICTHAELDICCGKFGEPIYAALQADAERDRTRIWRTSHIGSHRLAPTLIDFPTGRYWGHLDLETAQILTRQDQPVTALRDCYRGWAGLPPMAQIVEREILMQEGWAWCDYRQSGQIIDVDEVRSHTQVQIDFTSPDGQVSGSYHATVAVSGSVTTLNNSGKGDFRSIKQYQVHDLRKVLVET